VFIEEVKEDDVMEQHFLEAQTTWNNVREEKVVEAEEHLYKTKFQILSVVVQQV
jgi:hypothetical protein